jgi:hypothetical protein
MFGHDDDNKPQTNLPDPTPDDHLAAEPLDGGIVSSMNEVVAPVSEPVAAPATPLLKPQEDASAVPVIAPTPGVPAVAGVGGADDLLTLKQQALQQLTPLMEHLEQSPEEKFRTTMMMIQASDNQALIKNAYEAALAITDEKARAQALLDVVNEINYFTTQGEATPEATA